MARNFLAHGSALAAVVAAALGRGSDTAATLAGAGKAAAPTSGAAGRVAITAGLTGATGAGTGCGETNGMDCTGASTGFSGAAASTVAGATVLKLAMVGMKTGTGADGCPLAGATAIISGAEDA